VIELIIPPQWKEPEDKYVSSNQDKPVK